MKTPTYLNDKSQVIIFRQNQVTNRSIFNVKDAHAELSGSESVYIYIEDFTGNEITIDFLEKTTLKLYIIIRSSMDSDLTFKMNVRDNALIDVFTALRNTDRYSINLKREIFVYDATINMRNSLINRGKTNLNDYIYLQSENAELTINQLNIGSYEDTFNVTQDVFHNAKYTKSSIENALISNSNSSLSYSVSGRIFKGNEFSNCQQINRGVILKDAGVIAVEPKLYIDEYNVEASHGAAIGQIDEDQLYYLLSRGLTELESRSLIISGYTKPFINNIEDEDIKQFVERQILKKMNEVDVL